LLPKKTEQAGTNLSSLMIDAGAKPGKSVVDIGAKLVGSDTFLRAPLKQNAVTQLTCHMSAAELGMTYDVGSLLHELRRRKDEPCSDDQKKEYRPRKHPAHIYFLLISADSVENQIQLFISYPFRCSEKSAAPLAKQGWQTHLAGC